MRIRTLSILIACTLVAPLLGGCAVLAVGAATTGVAMVHDRRSAGTVVEDQNIELKAMNLKVQDEGLSNHTNISITSYNFVVLLTGQAENEQLRRRFVDEVRKMPNVRRVVDEIEVGPLQSFQDQANDAGILSQAKMALFGVDIEGFDPTRVKLVCVRGVIYLMGIVTAQEAEAAVAKVRYTNGVVKVVRLFEYI